MGGITLADNPPDDPEGSYVLPNGLYNASLLKDLTLLNFGSAQPAVAVANTAAVESSILSANDSSDSACLAAPTFSISDFLVPALHTKVWDDWQAADDFTAFDPQTLASSDINDMSLQLSLDGLIGNTPIWENDAVPADQAYDEFVFDLTPSHFETPATINVADLIVGPHSMASATASVSPLELTMASTSAYDQDLALANLYGFNECSTGTDSESESGSEESDISSDEDGEDDGEDIGIDTDSGMAKAVGGIAESTLTMAIPKDVEPINIAAQQQTNPDMPPTAIVPVSTPEDPNKRRMEEVLAARISNDLGPEHMAGLFKILKASTDEQNECDDDDEVEVDLSRLDETTLVQVYQYVEACCMQTMGSILAAEKRERAAQAAAAAAAEAKSIRRAHQRTPELSPSHSYSSSSSPSPSASSSKNGRRSSNGQKKRQGNSYHDPAVTLHRRQEADDIEQMAQNSTWSSGHPYKARRKRSNTVGSSTSGRKTQKDPHYSSQQQQYPQQTSTYLDHSSGAGAAEAVVLRAAEQNMEEMECGEDAEIDVVGI
ncbi:hypothetical protein BGX34_010122 [Mortierella sp. NVP85]|nr:hypothetical protein BGX34_010122 [Mortierella sp. NVP85]